MVMRDQERVERIRRALRHESVDALVCALPAHVLLTTGYWPVLGASLALVLAEECAVLAPEDEFDLARAGWADEVFTFLPAPLDSLQSTTEAVLAPLKRFFDRHRARKIAFAHGPSWEPASYAGTFLYGEALACLLREAAPFAQFRAADALLAELAGVKTPAEIVRIRTACEIAEAAFDRGMGRIDLGMTEAEIANQFRGPLSAVGVNTAGVQRADGFAFCMSGPNSAEAYRAYARSSDRRVRNADLILVHCNSYADGYWTDITRTYSLGHPDARTARLFDAVLLARQEALHMIRPGVQASRVDRAARRVMASFGFEREFKHASGHGVGFAAIEHNALPRIHPLSKEVLQVGMVFNLEPAVYIEGYGGLRHCDMVEVNSNGCTVLTPFQALPRDLVLPDAPGPSQQVA
jgi:Xaa-Pro aminopeptidase